MSEIRIATASQEWREVDFEDCPECGGGVQSLVSKSCPKDWWEDGADVRCTDCGFNLGGMTADEGCVSVNWLEDPDETVEWYRKRHASLETKLRIARAALKEIDDLDVNDEDQPFGQIARPALRRTE